MTVPETALRKVHKYWNYQNVREVEVKLGVKGTLGRIYEYLHASS
jgi:hypothetical protein